MALRHLGHAAGWVVACGAVPVALRELLGRRGGSLGTALALLATLALLLWLPRAAHRAFVAGRYAHAARRYRLIRALAFTARRERAARLSLAGCAAALGDPAAAALAVAPLDPGALEPAERVVWLNNRACLALAAHDPAGALALADDAAALRPDVPAVQHTRARALLAAGRTDDAISVLEAMRGAGELPPRLEAERCRDLATAWEHKGQPDYADDYRARAHALSAS